tara:strand:+ start:86 stop:544 length:459 start_codon:yes stop_codon:yes gene_type:complete
MAKRKILDKIYMNIAREVSTLSRCNRKKVGCIIVKDNNILSMGYNGTPTGMDNECEDVTTDLYLKHIGVDKKISTTKWYVLHAESNAIAKIAKSTNACDGATLYTTMSPCKECAKLIIQAGIKEVVFHEKYGNDPDVPLELLHKCNIQTKYE